MEIKGLKSLMEKLQARAAKATKDDKASVSVGYSTNYALFVHENLQALHGAAYNEAYIDQTYNSPRINKKGEAILKISWNAAAIAKGYGDPNHFLYAGKAHTRGENQQAKFLEGPARKLNNDGTLGKIVFEALLKKMTMSQALMLAGIAVQARSVEIVPVDKGFLKASAFVNLDARTST